MTKDTDQVKVVEKIVVYFDICSSTAIIEELLRTQNMKRWRNLIISLKKYLTKEKSSMGFELYKFLGDGWILLFEPRTEGLEIFDLLKELSDKFSLLYNLRIKKVLNTQISVVGIKFGMDIGSCIPVKMNGRWEYIGRPLNVAARLQGAIEQRGQSPANKCLVPKSLFAEFEDQKKIKRKYRVFSSGVKRVLKNISGGENYLCVKVEFD